MDRFILTDAQWVRMRPHDRTAQSRESVKGRTKKRR